MSAIVLGDYDAVVSLPIVDSGTYGPIDVLNMNPSEMNGVGDRGSRTRGEGLKLSKILRTCINIQHIECCCIRGL